jgi:hypothetical protein
MLWAHPGLLAWVVNEDGKVLLLVQEVCAARLVLSRPSRVTRTAGVGTYSWLLMA